MNFKNLAMWAVIVLLTVGLYNMFKNPQRSVNQQNTIISNYIEPWKFDISGL